MKTATVVYGRSEGDKRIKEVTIMFLDGRARVVAAGFLLALTAAIKIIPSVY